MNIDTNRLLHHQRPKNKTIIEYNNVHELFISKKDKNPDKIFTIFPGEKEDKFSYKSFEERYMQVANYLSNLDLEKGDRVNIIFSNSPDFLLFYFGGLCLGITMVPINSDLAHEEMAYIIKDCQSKAVFYEASLDFKIKYLESVISPRVLLKCINPLTDLESLNSDRIELDRTILQKVEIHDEAVIIYTSGTTGNPKGVVLSHLNLLADAKAISEWFQFKSETRTFCILPLFHNNAQITTLLSPLYAGGSTVIVKGKASLIAFWGLIAKYSITWTSVMASILSILLSLPLERKDNTLNGILCGGQVLTRSVQGNFEERFKVPIFEGYGLTETTSFSCINGFPATQRRLGTIGKPLPINDISIIDESGRHLGSDEEGEICIRGYNVANEYLGLSEKNKTSFQDGWFHSGDYGFKDNEGYFYFNGRKDSLIIKGGENIYPAELENVLYKNHKVEECAVIAIPDKLLGENICAFVKCKSTNTSEKELMAYCRGKIAPFKQAKRIIIINKLKDFNEIPKGPTKKVLYRKLRDYYTNNLAES